MVAAVVLASCASDSTAGFRTRNSASVTQCVVVNPVLNQGTVEVTINDPGCADGLVDVTRLSNPDQSIGSQWGPEYNESDPTLRTIARPAVPNSGFNIEAYDGQTPIEFIQVRTRNAGEPLSIMYSTITEVGVGDICMSPNTTQSGAMGYRTAKCDGDYVYDYLFSSGSGRKDLSRLDGGGGGYPVRLLSEPGFILVGTVMKNGFPTQKLTMRYVDGQAVYRFFKYSTPSEQSANTTTVNQVNVPTTTSTTTAPAQATTTSTVQSDDSTTTSTIVTTTSITGSTVITTTTVAATTTTAPAQTTTTSTTTTSTTTASTMTTSTTSTSTTTAPAQTTTTSTQPVVSQANINDDVNEACSRLTDASVYPAFSEWDENTMFELIVPTSCSDALTDMIRNGGIIGYGIGVQLEATNTETFEKINIPALGSEDGSIRFSGRLYPGNWELVLSHWTSVTLPDQTTIDVVAHLTESVDVASDPENPWVLCTPADITFDGRFMSLDCDYSSAIVHFFVDGTNDFGVFLTPGESTEVIGLRDGWTPTTISADHSGYVQHMLLMTCTEGCGTLPSAVDAEVIRGDGTITVTPIAGECSNLEIPVVELFFVEQVNTNLMVRRPQDRRRLIDAVLTQDATSIIGISDGADHIVLHRDVNRNNPSCESERYGFMEISIVPIPTRVDPAAVEDEVAVEPTPVLLTQLEYSTQDSEGVPVVVEDDQRIVEIPSSAVSGLVLQNAEVEVSADGANWIQLTESLPAALPIKAESKAIQVRYTFDDGSTAVVTKPIISGDEFRASIEASTTSSSSSNIWLIIAFAGILVLAGLGLGLRRRA